MSELRKPYVKLWAAEALLSDDLASLSDLEERVYFRLLMVASLEENRWTTRETPGLYRKCMTTGPKFARAITTLERLGMVERVGDDQLFVVNGPKWNEGTDRKRYPSDSPEATRERQSRSRQERVTSRDSVVSRVHIEEEKEKEEEKEEELEEEADSSSGEREIFSTALAKLPTKFQYDARTIDEMRDFARDYAGCHTELADAIQLCRRNNELCFPGNLRKYMPPLEGSDPVSKFRDNPIIEAQKRWREAHG